VYVKIIASQMWDVLLRHSLYNEATENVGKQVDFVNQL